MLAFWIQKDRYVFCCLFLHIKFFSVQTVHILSLLQLIAGLISSSFAGFRSAFDFLQNFFGRKCLFFHFLQQAPCNVGFLHFFFNNFATLDSSIRGTKVNFSSVFCFWFSKCGYGVCSDQFYSSVHDFKSQGSKLVSCKRLSAGWSKIIMSCSDSACIMWVLLCRNGAYFHSLQCHWLPLDTVMALGHSKFVLKIKFEDVSPVFSKLFILTDSSAIPKWNEAVHCDTFHWMQVELQSEFFVVFWT